ncbi:MAG: hypothetical protein J6U17_05800 [Kiritimatiellae bacterium]|nr:hypothetical protein [Kiritimatiellia bacterium]
MAEESRKGVVVEFDFAAIDGAELLYSTTAALMKENDIPFDRRAEAVHLYGGNYQGGLSEYFSVVKTKKTAAKAAKDLAELFKTALERELPSAVTPEFRAFVKTLSDKGLKVVIATRADADKAAEAFGDLVGENVTIYQETSQCYGCVKWDAWRRACAHNRLHNYLAVAVTGSGFGVKSALLAGMASVAVIRDNVAYQDFGGADEMVPRLDESVAKTILRMLKA